MACNVAEHNSKHYLQHAPGRRSMLIYVYSIVCSACDTT